MIIRWFFGVSALLGIVVGNEGAVPIKRHRTTDEAYRHEASKWKFQPFYNLSYFSPKEMAAAPRGPRNVINYLDNFYFVEVEIGTPIAGTSPQRFQLQIDTGSADTWVVDNSCGSNEMCKGVKHKVLGLYKKRMYKSSESSTWKYNKNPLSIYYGAGTCSGQMGEDTIKVAGITVPEQPFGQASTIAQVFATFPMDGIFGLAFQDMTETSTQVFTTRAVNYMKKPLFTVFLANKIKDDKISDPQSGLLTFGEIDTVNCDTGKLAYTPLSKAAYWQWTVEKFEVGDWSDELKAEAISDTGTPFVYGPFDNIDQVISKAGATYDYDVGLYMVDCDKDIPPLKFHFGTTELIVEGKHTIVDLNPADKGTPEKPKKCALGIDYNFGFDFDWLLGDGFFRAYCHIMDIGGKQIGFAPTKP